MANRSTGIYGHFGSFSATNQLPNVAGADVQSSEVALGDLAVVGSTLYLCTTATLGAAVWAAVGATGGGGFGGAWTPVLTPQAGTTPTLIAGGSYVRSGAPVAATDDGVSAALAVQVVVAALGTLDLAITGLPVQVKAASLSPVSTRFNVGGDASTTVIIERTSATSVRVYSPSPCTLETTIILVINLNYLVA